jgi:integrase
MLERLRYVTGRRNRNGNVRWYWQRPGHKLIRLPDNPVERMAMTERLNNAADAIASPTVLPRDSIGGLIQRYCNSDGYQALSPGTIKYYKRYLRDIEALGPGLPFASFTRQAVVDFIETYPKVHQRRQAAAVLKNLFQLARYYGLVDTDAAAGLRLRTSKPRDRIWSEEEIDRWLTAATSAPHMVTAFLLLQFTAQRPTDVLRMAWPHYAGAAIRLR